MINRADSVSSSIRISVPWTVSSITTRAFSLAGVVEVL